MAIALDAAAVLDVSREKLQRINCLLLKGVTSS
jgi:hypothetical protein